MREVVYIGYTYNRATSYERKCTKEMAHGKRVLNCMFPAFLVIAMVCLGSAPGMAEIDLQEEHESVCTENAFPIEETVQGFSMYRDISEEMEEIEEREIPLSWEIDVPFVYQEPELPTGCESVALTMLLMYHGFELEKTDIAKDYLLYSENGDFQEGYVGDPWSYEGAGCFPPALTKTAEIFLQDYDSDLCAVNVSGKSLELLFHYVAENIPVAIWNTQYMAGTYLYEEGFRENGIQYCWYENEHCVVLAGYDLENGTVTVNDSLEGVVERDLEEFEFLYDMIGKFAVVIL